MSLFLPLSLASGVFSFGLGRAGDGAKEFSTQRGAAIFSQNSHEMTAVGFEPTQLALVELESTPLDHSGKLSLTCCARLKFHVFTSS